MGIQTKTWVDKPLVSSQINWGHPFTAGLKDCFLFNESGGRNVINLARMNVCPVSSTLHVLGRKVSTDWTQGIQIVSGYSPNRLVTVMLQFTPLGPPTIGNHALWINRYSVSGDTGGLYLRMTTAGVIQLIKSQVSLDGSATLSSYSVGKVYIITFILDGNATGNWRIYEGSKLINSGTTGSTYAVGTRYPTIGVETDNGIGGDICNGVFGFCYVWRRAITFTEVSNLYAQPYQFILRPKLKTSFVSEAPAVTAGMMTTRSNWWGDL